MNKLKIKKISLENISQVKKLLVNYPYQELFFLNNINSTQKLQLTLNKLKHYLPDKNNIFLGAFVNDKLCGLLGYVNLCWDTKFYNFNCGKIYWLFANAKLIAEKNIILKNLINTFLKLIKPKKILWITVRINTKDLLTLHQLTNFKFKLMTTEIWFLWRKNKKYYLPYPEEKIIIRPGQKKDLKKLLKFAKYFTTNRTYLEENISAEKKLSMYKNWIENSILNKFSGNDEVLVGQLPQGEIVAFTTAKLDYTTENVLGFPLGYPGLVAVKENYRGGNINKYIMGCALNSLFKKTPYCLAPSHISNLTMLASESKTHPEIINTEYILHYWDL